MHFNMKALLQKKKINCIQWTVVQHSKINYGNIIKPLTKFKKQNIIQKLKEMSDFGTDVNLTKLRERDLVTKVLIKRNNRR